MNIRAFLFTILMIGAASACLAQGAPVLTLESSDPFSGTITTNRSQTILLNFNTLVTSSGILVTSAGVPISGTIAYGSDTTILVFTPLQLLPDGLITVDFSGVRAPNGGPPEGATTFSFTVDATRPSLVSSMPSSGQTGVSVDTHILLTFSETLESGDMPDPFTLSGPSGQVPLEFISYNRGSNTFVYAPVTPLAMSTTYTVDYSSALDLAGNGPLPPATFTFTTAAPPVLSFASSNPTSGEAGVSTNEPIVLTFSNDLDPQASSVTVTGGSLTVQGTLAVVANTAQFTPLSGYVPGVVYTVRFSGIRDFSGQAPAGLTQITFSTEGDVLTGRVDPQMVTLTMGERTGVTYLIQNLSASELRLQSSAAEFFVNDALVATANVPASTIIPAGSTVTVASDVLISEQIQNAARPRAPTK